MLKELEKLEMPDWLINIREFNVYDVLKDSLFYPACCFDGKPIKHLMGNAYSFVYVDHYVSKNRLIEILKNPGIKGYKIIHQESITKTQLVPNGWTIKIMPRDDNDLRYNSFSEETNNVFCEWLIFERLPEFDDSHNPLRFSLLYLHADGAAAYQALYSSNQLCPKFLSLINPGMGTDYLWKKSLMARSVFFQNTLPEYFIETIPANWPGYDERINISKNTFLRIWRKTKRDYSFLGY